MSTRTDKAGVRAVLATRIRLAALAIPVALLALIALAGPSIVLADPAPSADGPSSEAPVFSAELEEELEEASGEAGEDEEELLEDEGADEAAEAEDEDPFPPEECVLRTARSQVF